MSKADEAYEILKRRIISGSYPAMSDLSEELICDELKVSRTPVREAILKLKVNGFVQIVPNKGTFVRPVSHHLIDEIYDMRFLNEPYICIKAAQRMPKESLLVIRERLCAGKVVDEIHSKDYFIDLDSSMHLEFLSYCANNFLIAAMQNVYDHNERIRYFASDPKHDNSINEHLNIIDAVLKGDPENIKTAVLVHINASKQISENCFKEQPFYNF